MVFTFKLTHFIPDWQFDPFQDLIPAISHLEKFGLRQENFEL